MLFILPKCSFGRRLAAFRPVLLLPLEFELSYHRPIEPKGGMAVDKRAIKILFQTYWESTGWKSDAKRSIAPDDFAYAKSAGLIFGLKGGRNQRSVRRF